MATKHSPGPWQLHRLMTNWHGYPDWSTFCVRSKGNHCLATVGDVDRATSERNEANAILMVAAPDLLDAAGMLADVSNTKIDALTHPQLINLILDLRDAARYAVNKATDTEPAQ